mmetsp:Transcript_36376/g.56908  ORF Transcript_36376/g.56908 Transcript_36376/m.56908 type:complete len:133 (-) Transcript_36376:122-520(-)
MQCTRKACKTFKEQGKMPKNGPCHRLTKAAQRTEKLGMAILLTTLILSVLGWPETETVGYDKYQGTTGCPWKDCAMLSAVYYWHCSVENLTADRWEFFNNKGCVNSGNNKQTPSPSQNGTWSAAFSCPRRKK